jgi:Anthrone oxygenase
MDFLFLILICSTALVLGNEFSIAVFIHPSLSRANHLNFFPAIQVFAKLFGNVMPFWMGGTVLVHLIVLWITWRWPAAHSLWLLLASLLWIAIVLFSVMGPVPINDRVKGWDLTKLPPDWEDQRRRWDQLNAIRVVLIVIAFVSLLLSYKSLG